MSDGVVGDVADELTSALPIPGLGDALPSSAYWRSLVNEFFGSGGSILDGAPSERTPPPQEVRNTDGAFLRRYL